MQNIEISFGAGITERGMDLIFLEEFASSKEFCQIFFSKIGIEDFEIVKVEHSVHQVGEGINVKEAGSDTLMKLVYKTGENITMADLDQLAVTYSGIVNIGRKCKEVWNTIAIEDESIDPFQCNLIGALGGSWRLTHGQNRTECPKGLLSNKTIPCSSCMGRCVGVHPGKARYYQRNPEVQTMLNGKPLSKWGEVINPGDTISFGDVTISVV